jgi:hypothetical protein
LNALVRLSKVFLVVTSFCFCTPSGCAKKCVHPSRLPYTNNRQRICVGSKLNYILTKYQHTYSSTNSSFVLLPLRSSCAPTTYIYSSSASKNDVYRLASEYTLIA